MIVVDMIVYRLYSYLINQEGYTMNTNATKLTYAQFERDFESISLFYFDRHFTQVTEMVWCIATELMTIWHQMMCGL